MTQNIQHHVKVYHYLPTILSKESGHVALELDDGAVDVHTGMITTEPTYISFWPPCAYPDNPEHCCYNCPRESHWHNLIKDQNAYSSPTGLKMRVYQLFNLDAGGLNTPKIKRIYKKISKNKNSVWGAAGSGPLGLPYERNCASLTLYLLEKGGVPNPFATRVRTFYRTALMLSLPVCLLGAYGYGFYKRHAISSDIANAKEKFQKSREDARGYSETAKDAWKASPSPQSPAQVASIELADMLMDEMFYKVADAAEEAYKVIAQGRSFLGVASMVAVVAGVSIGAAAYVGGKQINRTITPDSVAYVAFHVEAGDKRIQSAVVMRTPSFQKEHPDTSICCTCPSCRPVL